MTAPAAPDGVLIPAASVFNEVRGLTTTVTRIETKLDAQADQFKRLDDHETRIRLLERARWPLPSVGALAGLSGLITALWPHLGH